MSLDCDGGAKAPSKGLRLVTKAETTVQKVHSSKTPPGMCTRTRGDGPKVVLSFLKRRGEQRPH